MRSNKPQSRTTCHPRLIVESLESRLMLLGQSLLISEILADNYSVLTDDDGEYSDFLEVFNPTSDPVELGGWYLTDDTDNLTKWRLPAHLLEAGGRLVIFASGKDRVTAEEIWHTNFRLDAGGEYLAMVQPDGTTIAHEYSPNYPRQKEDVSYGLAQDVKTLVDVGTAVQTWVPSDGPLGLDWTLPEYDDSLWSAGSTGVGFEVGAGQLSAIAYGNSRGSVGTQTFGGSLGMDFVVNVPISVTDLGVFDSNADGLFRTITAQIWSRSGNAETLLAQQTFSPADPGELIESDRLKPLPAPLELPPGDYTVVAYGYGNGEPNGNVGTGGPADGQKTMDDGNGVLSFVGGSRYGSTAGVFPATVDGGPANRYSAGTFRYSVAVFDAWIGADVADEMHGVNATALSRIDFDVSDPGRFGALDLEMQYDDGFVAYLNGVEVARSNLTGTPVWNSRATDSRAANEATRFESFNVTAHLSHLRSGTNTLAIHGLNASAGDNDFLMSPRLMATGPLVEAPLVYFDVVTPGAPNDLASSFAGFVDALDFSAERGFYDQPLFVKLATPTDGATIRYTTNGTPPTEVSGQVYTGPISVDSTTTLSVAAFKNGLAPTESVTHSYVFLDDVVDMSGVPSGYPSTWGGTTADYGMSQNANDLPLIAGDPDAGVDEAKEAIKQSLLALPTISIVMSSEDLFDARSGIYSNPSARGDAWERGTSVEYLLPNGSSGFQINAGIQIMGGTSRNLGFNIKQSFRLVFKNEYGPGRLQYPFFPDNPVESFNTLALRSNTRDNWTYRGSERRTATYLRDEWAKAAQADMGQLATSGRFVHLYINGMYWGIYNPTERPDAAFVSSHTGAEEEALDTVKFCCPQRVVDGDWDEWNELRALAASGLADHVTYQRIQGNNPDGTRNPDYSVLIDIDNFIDFVIHGQFTGSQDWPGNYYVVRDENVGFQFFTWDNDLAFFANDKVTPSPGHNWWTESPGELDIALRRNTEYRLRFADRVNQHYFDDGALTSGVAVERWDRLTDDLRVALIAESARWGDYRRDVAPDGQRVLYTPHDQWPSIVNSVSDHLEDRPDTVLSQLRSHELYPDVNAPVFSQHGGKIVSGFQLGIEVNDQAPVYLTTNGEDPRLVGGAINTADAILYDGPVTLTGTTHIKARALVNSTWSALTEATFVVADIVVSEINYNPYDPTASELAAGYRDSDEFEFLELANIGASETDLIGLQFVQVDIDGDTQGVAFDFSSGAITTLAPGERILVVENAEAFAFRYGENLPVTGQYSGRLSNSGEAITLRILNETLQQFAYSDEWYPATDGNGASLEIIDSTGDLSLWEQPSGWRASEEVGGTPGDADSDTPAPGDANHDGVFNSSDLVLVFVAGEYEDDLEGNSTFEEGDWNGDGDFTSADLVFVFQAGTYVVNAIGNCTQDTPVDKADGVEADVAAALDLVLRSSLKSDVICHDSAGVEEATIRGIQCELQPLDLESRDQIFSQLYGR